MEELIYKKYPMYIIKSKKTEKILAIIEFYNCYWQNSKDSDYRYHELEAYTSFFTSYNFISSKHELPELIKYGLKFLTDYSNYYSYNFLSTTLTHYYEKFYKKSGFESVYDALALPEWYKYTLWMPCWNYQTWQKKLKDFIPWK